MITQELVKYLFEYRSGFLYWAVANSPRVKVGELAGSVNSDGYSHIQINGSKYKTHRLIFLLHHGYLPETVDHIDGDTTNNRVENLRVASTPQNQHNARRRLDNSSGVKGVSWHSPLNKWRVQIQTNRVKKHIGYFDDLELAELVAIEARDKYHKEFARHQ